MKKNPYLRSTTYYRPDIDGLRGISIILVVGFHTFPKYIPGGFIGVDIFFVISGFLITSILLNDISSNNLNIIDFYKRRIRRIFPSLIVIFLTCIIFGWYVLLPHEYMELGRHIFGGALFGSNFVLLHEAGYFNSASALKPLLHLWSLAIEEQFYVFWPFLLWASWRRNYNLLFICIIALLVSFGFDLRGLKGDVNSLFFLPQTRFWELLLGAILATCSLGHYGLGGYLFAVGGPTQKRIANLKLPPSLKVVLLNFISFAGVALIVYGIFSITSDDIYPGFFALLPTIGAFLIIGAGSKAFINRAILSNSILVWVGLISFPLYLWHWPLISFAHIIEGEKISNQVIIGIVVTSFFLSWLTYEFVEKYFLFGGNAKIKSLSLVFGMITIALLGYSIFQFQGFEFRAKEILSLSKVSREWEFPGKGMDDLHIGDKTFRLLKSGKKEVTIFIGDSNIEQYFPRVEELVNEFPSKSNSVIFATSGGCLPIRGVQRNSAHAHCGDLMEKAYLLASSNNEIITVVIGAQWNMYLHDGSTLIGDWGGGQNYEAALIQLSNDIKNFKLQNKRVYVIANIPTGIELDPIYRIQRKLSDFPVILRVRDGGIPLSILENKYGSTQLDLKDYTERSGAIFINPLTMLCINGFCNSVDSNGDQIYKDSMHLRPSFVRDKAKFIDPMIISR